MLIPVVQQCPDAGMADVRSAMQSALKELDLAKRVRPGQRIAITAGSRGINQIDRLLAVAVDFLKSLGAQPLVVAAMGSHGGGTESGQLAVLNSLGVTPETVGCPVVAGTEAVVIGQTRQGVAVHQDAVAAGCDGILVINRVKPHTSFHGPLESGLVKMLVVGLGKAAGAARFHSLGPQRLGAALAEMGRVILTTRPVLGGIAVLENGRDEVAALVPVQAPDMIEQEQALLVRSKALLPRLPVDELDLLILGEMGKEISGTGMDTNVIGRMAIYGVPEGEPAIARIGVLDLSAGSHGNANGMGLADFITERFRAKIDFAATYLNSMTATFVQRARMPIVLPTDRALVEAALRTLGTPDPGRVRMIYARNTLELTHLQVSQAIWERLSGSPRIAAAGPARPMQFAADGTLL